MSLAFLHLGRKLWVRFYLYSYCNYYHLMGLDSWLCINFSALSKFDEHDFMAVKQHLELVPGASVADPDLDALELYIKWDEKEILETAQLQLVRLHTKMATEACNG